MIVMPDGYELSSRTETLMLGQLIFGSACWISGILQVYFKKILGSNLSFIGSLIAVSLLIFGGVWLCKLLVDFVNRKLKVEDLTKYRNDYLIAFESIGTCAVFIEVMVFFVEFTLKSNILIFQCYFITTASIYYFFIFPTFDKTCTWMDMDGTTSDRHSLTNLICHGAVLLVSCRIAVEFDGDEVPAIIFYQLVCSVVTAITFIDFAHVWCAGVQFVNFFDEVAPQPVESRRTVYTIDVKPDPVHICQPVAPKPCCNICSFPYTENGCHTPRIIITCGHTICEQCAKNLLNVKLESVLVCPFCQKPTVVNGPAGILPKNFALLEQMAEMQQDPFRNS